MRITINEDQEEGEVHEPASKRIKIEEQPTIDTTTEQESEDLLDTIVLSPVEDTTSSIGYSSLFALENEQPLNLDPLRSVQMTDGTSPHKILYEWILEVLDEMEEWKYALPHAVVLFERYSVTLDGQVRMNKDNIQGIFLACLWITSKWMEETIPMNDLLYICASSYTRPEMIQLEYHVLTALNYEIYVRNLFHALHDAGVTSKDQQKQACEAFLNMRMRVNPERPFWKQSYRQQYTECIAAVLNTSKSS